LALRGSKNLKINDMYNQVFVNKDMARAERATKKRLREARRKLNAELPVKSAGGLSLLLEVYRHQGKLFYRGIRSDELGVMNWRIFDKQNVK
jgi:hypothetical protein